MQFKGNTFPLLPPLDNSPETRAKVKFVQDTSKYWYKPEISREQGELGTALLVWWPIGRHHGLPRTMSALGKNSFLHSGGGGHREEAGLRVRKEKKHFPWKGVGLLEADPWSGQAKSRLSQAK